MHISDSLLSDINLYQIYSVSSSTWQQLPNKCPTTQVMCTKSKPDPFYFVVVDVENVRISGLCSFNFSLIVT